MPYEELIQLIQQSAKDGVTILDLSFQGLTSLPESIGQLVNLIQLDLSGNQLTSLPESIGQLANLHKLDLSNTPLSPPLEIQGHTGKEILSFYRQQLEQDIDHLYEAKLLILGEAGAGKTTLAMKILDSHSQLEVDQDSTLGINVFQWNFPLQNGKEFRVNIWDFGGQEIYHAIHQFFLTKRSLYILVADTRKEDTDFYHWLNTIELLSDNCPILIIKNEKQERKREINERQLRGEFTNLKETIATNFATNRGFPEIITTIKHYIQTLPHVGTKLPKKWVNVREALEHDDRDYISLDEYLHICQDNGFTRKEDSLQLSGYLHDLGVCLHFQEDELLMRTVILNPTWGTNAVYKVLDNVQVVENLGKFTREDLKSIWHEDRYTAIHSELLRLMMNFKLCYEIPSNHSVYIAPQLLSPNQPEYEWDESENLFLRYEYEFMPKGILTRFIVETHHWIDQQTCVWKTGVVLSKDNTKAELIELYRYNKGEIRIRVEGKRKRDLLTIVRHELDKIHASYERLNYKNLISCNCSTCINSQTPFWYDFNRLYAFLDAGKFTIQCYESGDSVEIQGLIDDILSIDKQDTLELQSIPSIIFNRSISNVTNFLGQIKDQGSELLYEAKVLIVGEPGAGKTSLMKKIINPEYQIPNNEDPTLGISVYSEWTFPYFKDKAITFRANIWDFGGQQIQYALHHFFLTSNSLYILVADDRQQRTDFDYWFDIISLLGGNSPVLIVLNERSNKSITNLDVSAYRKRYQEITIERRDVELAVNDGRFKSLTQKIQEMLSNLEHIGRIKLPAKWLLVREAIEKLRERNHIKIDEYFEICSRHEITEEADQLLLSKYLHNLGVILHFQDDSNLSTWIALNPQWVANAIYTILSDKKLENSGGKFKKNWLFDAWKNKGYTFQERNYLLNLMKKDNLDLCYEMSSSNCRDEYIVPQLLKTIKPDYIWNYENNLRFCFQYPFSPKGIITQLIVRLSTYLVQIDNEDLAWRYGAIFTKNDSDIQTAKTDINQLIEETKAEVIEEINKDGQKVINIRISGSIGEKKEFLTIIRKEILEIHKRFGSIKWEEKIPCNCSECKMEDDPYLYNLEKDLKHRLRKEKFKIECNKSLEMVEILKLIDDVIDIKDINIENSASNVIMNFNATTFGVAAHVQGDQDVNSH
ncbi:MAG: COR domain-containing protein [Pseudanabaena sp. ELA645]